MGLVITIIGLGVLTYFAVGELFGKGSHKCDERIRQQMDELHRQEQLDKIEQAVMEGKDKVNIEGYRNETGNRHNIPFEELRDTYERIAELERRGLISPNSARERKKNICPDPSKWIKKDNVKTNVFNNQFILHNLADEVKLQCVACGSLDVSDNKMYGDHEVSKREYVCNTCGNQYTNKE